MGLPRSFTTCSLAGAAAAFLLTTGCAKRVETRPSPPAPPVKTFDIGGPWSSHYSDDIYDLPDYILKFKTNGQFEGSYHRGWSSGKLSGSYRWDSSTALLNGTDNTEIGDIQDFTMELKVEGDKLIEVTDEDLHLIFVRDPS